ncbi:hypothetical protein KXQ82_16245 [Mucilaginibacter sp. HMF5004]|uniref:hypothetical protein n=1 Tax=Mucilaginibacter rivuli TaxID=2857527 RepID=UPI001C5DFAE9|nr:hypothetical protein [Mucilaginibacter rivuli]MBW4891279.1 hypothetical protein [Mucilaginibacter rivuli]
MTATPTKRTYLIAGFVAIVVLYSLYNIYLVDVSYYNQIPRKVRHIARFVSILMVYGIGIFTLTKYVEGWVISLWNGIYLIAVALLLLIGIYDWSIGGASSQIRNIANTLHEFLISPMLFIALYIIHTKLLRRSV